MSVRHRATKRQLTVPRLGFDITPTPTLTKTVRGIHSLIFRDTETQGGAGLCSESMG